MKKKHTPVCEIENPEFWYGLGKILVKKKHPPVCEIENPEFWYGRGKILVKRNTLLFSKPLNFGMVAVKFW